MKADSMFVVVTVVVIVDVLTGRDFNASATGFAVVAAASLQQYRPPPEIPGEFFDLYGHWHRLIQVREEAAEIPLEH